jgi:hypothetical protein
MELYCISFRSFKEINFASSYSLLQYLILLPRSSWPQARIRLFLGVCEIRRLAGGIMHQPLFYRYMQLTWRSLWPRGLRHQQSSLARKLGSWVRIQLKAWMSVCAFILRLCCPVCRQRPCDGLIPCPRSPTNCV